MRCASSGCLIDLNCQSRHLKSPLTVIDVGVIDMFSGLRARLGGAANGRAASSHALGKAGRADVTTRAVGRSPQGPPLDSGRTGFSRVELKAKPDPSADRIPFLPSVTVDYGPQALLGEFFLRAQRACAERGITLVSSSLDDLVAVNRANADTWLPVVSIFDSTTNKIANDESYCVLGLDPNGEVVATQAVRLIRLGASSFADHVRSMELFYSDPAAKGPGEACTITAPTADRIVGRVAYSGAVWYRPDYRKRGLTAILPRVARAYALTRWATNHTVTLMAEGIVKSGTPQRVGYPHVEWEAQFHNNALAGPRFAFLWMDDAEVLGDLRAYVETAAGLDRAQVDAVVEQRRA